MPSRPEDILLALYDEALERHGDTPEGALWPNARDRETRFDVMLEVLADRPPGPIVLCDLGCGTGELLARIRERGLADITYVGLDRSAQAIALARAKFPGERFVELDVTAPDADLSQLDCDFLVANGLFTVRHTLTEAQMRAFLDATVRAAWPRVRRGLAFNVMSRHVEWVRDDLFHASMDEMAALLHELAGRRVRMRADYGLYEFTCYAWRDAPAAVRTPPAIPERDAHASLADAPVPVLRPLLPRAEALLPYLQRIDASRVYTNFGPLATTMQARLAEALALPPTGVACAANGTLALEAMLLARVGRATTARPLALMPAYTFVATAVAAEACGFEPFFADVSASDWMLDPVALATQDLSRVGVVIVVSAYGRPVSQRAWRAFEAATGIPVVIDGAACFEAACAAPADVIGEIPVALSLHATKGLSSGEGGAVVCRDLDLVAKAGRALNFGFHHSRDSRGPSVNGKMSEYHAAVGLADLDGWPAKQAAFAAVQADARALFDDAGFGDRLVGAPVVCSSYLLFDAGSHAAAVQEALRAAGVEFRHWYGFGLHQQSWFAARSHAPLPVTVRIAPRLLGLPMAPDLATASVARVAAAVATGMRK
jgi:dTDP-4-amino-4,6-dideoxygalactose transaminase